MFSVSRIREFVLVMRITTDLRICACRARRFAARRLTSAKTIVQV